jgi:acetolactate synthase-1/2/3 large subunit
MTLATAISNLFGGWSRKFGRKGETVKMSVARLVAAFLSDAKVPYLFGLTGHSIFPITDALYATPDTRFVPVMHELSAAYMAAAYAKGKRTLGVCTASAGAGVTNLLTGIAYAHKESLPVIVLAADVSRRHSGKGASSWHEIPQREMFDPITKSSVTLESANEAAGALRDALRLATTGRKGPVYIGIPRDVQQQEIDAPEAGWLEWPKTSSAPEARLLDRVGEELLHASSPVIIAGGGVYWSRAEDEIRELAELLAIPFGTTPSHKGLLSEDHPLALGVLGFGAFPFANAFALAADLILAVGVTFSEGLTLGFGHKVIPQGAKIIQIDADPRELGKIYPNRFSLCGDAKTVLRELLARLRKAGGGKKDLACATKLTQEKADWRAKIRDYSCDTGGPIDQWHVYRALKEAIDENTVVVGAGGTAELIRRFVAPSYAYHSGEMRAIGFGLATSIGLSCAFPGRVVVCVSGDGSFMLESQELATAMALNLPIVLIIVRNNAYGNMKRDQIRHYGGRVIGTELHLPDLCALAASYGVESERVAKPDALLPAIKRALAQGKPALLDVLCPIEGI